MTTASRMASIHAMETYFYLFQIFIFDFFSPDVSYSGKPQCLEFSIDRSTAQAKDHLAKPSLDEEKRYS